MSKTIFLLLVLGTLSPLATAQRGTCPLGNEVIGSCPRALPSDPAPSRAAVPLRDQVQPVRGSAQVRGRFASQNGWGRAACRGPGSGPGARRSGGGCRGDGWGRGNARTWGNGSGARRAITPTTPTTAGEVAIIPAVAGEQSTFVQRLQATLEAELYARDYYAVAARTLGGPRRYSNLTRAEDNHAIAIANAIESLGGSPSWVQGTPVVPPQSVAEADEHGLGIELYVIDVYEGLIADAPSGQLRMVFQNIQRANHRHLRVVGG